MAAAFVELGSLIDRLETPASHRDLLRRHVDGWAPATGAPPQLPAVELALLGCSAAGGTEANGVALATACLALYLGADLLDNLADDELPPWWEGVPGSVVGLAASTLLAALPYLALDGAALTDSARGLLVTETAKALVGLSAAQAADLASTWDDEVTVPGARSIVEGKGAELGFFLAAGAAAGDIDRYPAYFGIGASYGAALQLASDVADIWADGTSRDLTNGKRTLPIAYALTRAQGRARTRLVDLLHVAGHDPTVHGSVRAALLDLGAAHYALLVVGVYRARCRHLLDQLPATGPAGQRLLDLVDGLAPRPVP